MQNGLQAGDPFPQVNGNLLDGAATSVNDLIAGRWAIVLFYRGDW